MVQRGHLDVPIIGVAKAGWTLEQLNDGPATAWRSTAASTKRLRQAVSSCCATSTATTATRRRSQQLRKALGPAQSTRCTTWPSRPSMFGDRGRATWRSPAAPRTRRVVVEKPFGRDLASAQRAEPDSASARSTSRQIFRIDHYLGKEPVQNILFFRFANRSWSRSGTATTSRASRSRWPRTSASQGRGTFYEEAGAIRDVIQNHMLQVVSML